MPTKHNRSEGHKLHIPSLGEALGGEAGPTKVGITPIQRLDHAIERGGTSGKKAGSKKNPIQQKGKAPKASVHIPSKKGKK